MSGRGLVYRCFISTILSSFMLAVFCGRSIGDPSVTQSRPASVSNGYSLATETQTPDMPLALYANYFRISGVDLIPLSNSINRYHSGYGCVYLSGSSGWVNATVNIPLGAYIQSLRIYWDISVSGANVTAHLYKYSLSSNEQQNLVSVESDTTSGRGNKFVYLDEADLVTSDYAYTLWVYFDTASSNVSFCGARIYYTDPETFRVNQILIR